MSQVSCFARSVYPRASLFKRILRIANLDADLFLQLLPAQLGLAFAQIILLMGGVLAVVGIFFFSRRELATAQGTQ